jgi:hypothetical protein
MFVTLFVWSITQFRLRFAGTPPLGASAVTGHDQAPRLALGAPHVAHHIDSGTGAALMEFGNREVADDPIDRLQDQSCLGAAAVADLTDTLPAPGEEAKALGEKRFQVFLDSVAQLLAKGADNDNEPPETGKANEA